MEAVRKMSKDIKEIRNKNLQKSHEKLFKTKNSLKSPLKWKDSLSLQVFGLLLFERYRKTRTIVFFKMRQHTSSVYWRK